MAGAWSLEGWTTSPSNIKQNVPRACAIGMDSQPSNTSTELLRIEHRGKVHVAFISRFFTSAAAADVILTSYPTKRVHEFDIDMVQW